MEYKKILQRKLEQNDALEEDGIAAKQDYIHRLAMLGEDLSSSRILDVRGLLPVIEFSRYLVNSVVFCQIATFLSDAILASMFIQLTKRSRKEAA